MKKWQDYVEPIRETAFKVGLSPKPTVFEAVDRDTMYELVSYGVPSTYSHWSFGKDFLRHKSQHDKGHSLVYEIVVNLDPAQAFLLEDNRLEEQLFVISHVQGHSDLFSRNMLCKKQRGDMNHVMRAASQRFLDYAEKYGSQAVEQVIDYGHMLIQHVDEHASQRVFRYNEKINEDQYDFGLSDTNYSLPSEVEWRNRMLKEKFDSGIGINDLLYYLIHYNYGLIPEWQVDILDVIRERALYFKPQSQVSILHEGWASLWTTRIQSELDMPSESAYHDSLMQANVAGVPFHGRHFNRYWFGLTLLKYLEKNGVDLFDIVSYETDQSIIRNYVDRDFVVKTPELYKMIYNDTKTFKNETKEPWEIFRDEFAHSLNPMPLIKVEIERSDNTMIIIRAEGPLDGEYAKRVVEGLNWLSRRKVCVCWDGCEQPIIIG